LSDQVSVGTEKGEYLADAVILTVPLGCLKRSTIEFTPPLPPRVHSAIEHLGYGNLEKVFLRFEHSWWNTSSSEKNPPNSYIFLPPDTLPSEFPHALLHVYSLASLPVNAQPVLMIYLSAEWSTVLTSLSPHDIVELFQTHYLPILPNYGVDCAISDVFCTNWTNDPWSYGSYTHIPVGSDAGIDDLRVLGEKIASGESGQGGLWFAGEHAGLNDLATANGALSSGKQAAVHVLHDLFGRKEAREVSP
jgi:monoamine oxidase